MSRRTVPVALGVILLLAAALRLYDISGVPTELDADEIDLYNSAYSIATTGHDLDGTLLPFFYSPGTRNPPVYAIAAYGSSLIFGRTPLGLRLPAAIFGLIAIMLLYGIAFELTQRIDVALIAAVLMATQPIFVHFARVGWEPASELPFLLGGVYLLLRAMRYVNDADPANFRCVARTRPDRVYLHGRLVLCLATRRRASGFQSAPFCVMARRTHGRWRVRHLAAGGRARTLDVVL